MLIIKGLAVPFAKLVAIAAATASAFVAVGVGLSTLIGTVGRGISEFGKAFFSVGGTIDRFGQEINNAFNVVKGISEYNAAMAGLDEIAKKNASERYGVSEDDAKAGTGLLGQFGRRITTVFGLRKGKVREYEEADIARSRIGDEGMARMQSDAEGIFSAIGRNLTTEERKGLSDAAAKGEESLILYLQELGLSAAQAGTFVKGAGGATDQLAYKVNLLSIKAEQAAAETARLQAALDRQAAAAAAAQAAIERTAKRAYEFSNAMIVFATNVQKAKNRQQEFTKELMTATLKGGASLAANFQTSFQQTRTEGQIASLQINQNASKKQEELRRKGSQDVFAAVSKFGEIGKIFEGLATGGGTQVQQDFFNDMNACLIGNKRHGRRSDTCCVTAGNK